MPDNVFWENYSKPTNLFILENLRIRGFVNLNCSILSSDFPNPNDIENVNFDLFNETL
jgi:hypothetical protein